MQQRPKKGTEGFPTMVCKERPSTVPRSAGTRDRTHHGLVHLTPPSEAETRADSGGRAWPLVLQVSSQQRRSSGRLVCRWVGPASSLSRPCTRRPGTPGVKGLEAAAEKTPAPTTAAGKFQASVPGTAMWVQRIRNEVVINSPPGPLDSLPRSGTTR